MMKYIFCIIALLIQPVFSWYVYHKQDKKKAALKMPMLYYSRKQGMDRRKCISIARGNDRR